MSGRRAGQARVRAMPLFYAAWAVMCLLAFLTSILLGFVVLSLGVAVRLLEANLAVQREVLAEQRALRRELLARRAGALEEAGG